MEELAEMHRFNAWANREILAGVRQLTPEQLDQQQEEGMYRPILGVLRHLAQVELGYLLLIRGESSEWMTTGPWNLHQIEAVLQKTGSGLVEVARTSAPDATFHIPWFERDVTVFQGLGQVLTHSINHRADINQWLPRFGVASTQQDYINLVLSET